MVPAGRGQVAVIASYRSNATEHTLRSNAAIRNVPSVGHVAKWVAPIRSVSGWVTALTET